MANITCGHCHETHGSVAEVRACSARKTTTRSSVGSKAVARPARRAAQQYPNNPWFQDHLAAELVYSSGGMYSRQQLIAIVIREFQAYADKAIHCGNCGHESAWWRPTVKAFMCTGCESLRCSRYNEGTKSFDISWTKSN